MSSTAVPITKSSSPPPPLSEILDEVEAFVRRYLVLSHEQAVATSLWVVHTYVIDAAQVTPYLCITSPERRTGKSRLLEVLASLVMNPVMTANMSPAVLFRTIEEKPTSILFDEVDAVFGRRDGNEELRGLLNAGFQSGGQVQRCEVIGRSIVVRSYSAFAPKALAAIGNLPDTIADRSIHIRMKRKMPTEKVQRFRRRLVAQDAAGIREQLAAWGATAVDTLAKAWPVLPGDLDDRAQDAWEPLLAIADLAGHGWDGRARHAALALASARDNGESLGVLLLEHVREAFGDRERITTAELLSELVEREDAPWAAWWGNDVEAGRPKGPASRLARLLKPFGIVPKVLRTSAGTPRGYERDSFAEAWDRYASDPAAPAPPERTQHATHDANQPSEQDVSLLRSSEELGEVTSRCPECGFQWFQGGHAAGCSRGGMA